MTEQEARERGGGWGGPWEAGPSSSAFLRTSAVTLSFMLSALGSTRVW